uniref:IQ motif containing B1 n=1 Tax=Kryptolebias marmoratus TaxID=37003 RepID=A0A3Q3A651_KRYMA
GRSVCSRPSEVLNSAAVRTSSSSLARVKSELYHSGVLNHCVQTLSLHPSRLRGNWGAAATLAHLTTSCCVGVEPGSRSEAFHRLFLPSVIDGLLPLACQLMSRAEVRILSSVHYEQIQMCDDITVSLLCIQMWIQICTVSSNESVLLLLNEAVGQLALSSDSAVGGASITLMLLMAKQLGCRFQPLLLKFKGLDSLLEKDWRGRGFDQDIDQLIAIIQSEQSESSQTERVRAACVIQAAWRSYRTRRRVKSLNRAASLLLNLLCCLCVCVCVCSEQVQMYLQECERRAAVVIQSFWRGFRDRRYYNNTLRDTLRQKHTQQQAARTLQRAKSVGQQRPCPSWRSTFLGEQQRREEQHVETLLAYTHTQLELLQGNTHTHTLCDHAESFLSSSASISARARSAHSAVLQASRLPWWRTLGEPDTSWGSGPAHLQDLEAELGGLFIGGSAEVSGHAEVDGLKL